MRLYNAYTNYRGIKNKLAIGRALIRWSRNHMFLEIYYQTTSKAEKL